MLYPLAEGCQRRASPLGSISFIFIQFSIKNYSNNKFKPLPLESAVPSPCLGNPGSATGTIVSLLFGQTCTLIQCRFNEYIFVTDFITRKFESI